MATELEEIEKKWKDDIRNLNENPYLEKDDIWQDAVDVRWLIQRVKELEQWVSDLQSGLYINCVYCGHRYAPGTPGTMSKVLYEHIKVCPKHPLSKAEAKIKELQRDYEKLFDAKSSPPIDPRYRKV